MGQFPPSCHIEVKPSVQSMALLWLWEASSFRDEKYSPGRPDFLGNYYSRSLPCISSTSLMHFQISGANVFIKYLFDVSYYEFSFLVFWNTSYIEHNGMSASSQIPQLLLVLSRGNPDRTRGGASSKEWPQVAGSKGLCTVRTAVFGLENRGSIDQIGVNGEWNRHSEEQRWYWGEARRETQGVAVPKLVSACWWVSVSTYVSLHLFIGRPEWCSLSLAATKSLAVPMSITPPTPFGCLFFPPLSLIDWL